MRTLSIYKQVNLLIRQFTTVNGNLSLFPAYLHVDNAVRSRNTDRCQLTCEEAMATLTEEHKEIRRSVREFVEREINPIADELDNAEKEIPMPVIRKMAELGYFGLIFPHEHGG